MSSLSPAMPIPDLSVFPGLCNAPAKRRPEPGLSRHIQDTLVPPVDHKDLRVEAFGRTVPKEDAGGDLVDLVASGQDLITYVADVSGHGLRSAVLMGMLKTAVRYGLHIGQPLAMLLDDINRVLPAVKEANMYATLAALRFDGSNEIEYISAGHVPLLHYRRRKKDVVRYSTPQFPLGMFVGAGYVSRRVWYEAGDIFALVTDGVVETVDDFDAEFGFDRLAQTLCDLQDYPLPEIFNAVQGAVTRHGARQDDQTILLVRAVASE